MGDLGKPSHSGMDLGSPSRLGPHPCAVLVGIISKSTDFGVGLTKVAAVSLTSFVTLSKLFNSKPHFVHL